MPPMIASPAFGVFPGNSRSLRSTGRRVAAVEPEDVHGLGVGGARQEAPGVPQRQDEQALTWPAPFALPHHSCNPIFASESSPFFRSFFHDDGGLIWISRGSARPLNSFSRQTLAVGGRNGTGDGG